MVPVTVVWYVENGETKRTSFCATWPTDSIVAKMNENHKCIYKVVAIGDQVEGFENKFQEMSFGHMTEFEAVHHIVLEKFTAN